MLFSVILPPLDFYASRFGLIIVLGAIGGQSETPLKSLVEPFDPFEDEVTLKLLELI